MGRVGVDRLVRHKALMGMQRTLVPLTVAGVATLLIHSRHYGVLLLLLLPPRPDLRTTSPTNHCRPSSPSPASHSAIPDTSSILNRS